MKCLAAAALLITWTALAPARAATTVPDGNTYAVTLNGPAGSVADCFQFDTMGDMTVGGLDEPVVFGDSTPVKHVTWTATVPSAFFATTSTTPVYNVSFAGAVKGKRISGYAFEEGGLSFTFSGVQEPSCVVTAPARDVFRRLKH